MLERRDHRRLSRARRQLRPEHFERIAPVCPTCRAICRTPPALVLGPVARAHEGDVVEGALACPERACRREHPIIDGIPIVVADIQSYVAHQLPALHMRGDMSPYIESLLGDCAGAGTDHDRTRNQLSSYARGHYADLDPDEPASGASGAVDAGGAENRAGTVADLLDRALALVDAPDPAAPGGVWLEVGCAVGRTSFELAARVAGDDGLVVGVDLNFAMLQTARRVATEGVLSYPHRRVGVVYDRRTFAVDVPARDRVAFWACDAMALPFSDGAFAGAVSFNVLDCVSSPLAHLVEVGRVVVPGGCALLASPYDWATSATPMDGWLGGHSQRGDHRGSSAAEVRRLLTDPSATQPPIGLRLVGEDEAVGWDVYVHERATMRYQVHLVAARSV